MKRVFKNICIASALILLAGACKEDTLLFPPAVEDTGADGIIDIIAKPSDVQIVGNYDYKFNVIWPKFSDKIEKVTIFYTDDGEEKSVEYTNFTQPGLLEMSQQDEYTFTLVGHSATGTATSPVTIVAENKGLFIEDVIQAIQITTTSPFAPVRLYWLNHLQEDLEITYTYPTETGQEIKTISSSAEEDEILFPGLLGGEYTVNVLIKDTRSNTVSSDFNYEFTPVEFSTNIQKAGWTPWARHGYDAGFSAERAIDGTVASGYEFVSGSNGNPTPYKISFTKTRYNSDPHYRSALAEFPTGPHDLIVVKSAVIYSGAVEWGVNPSKARVYGILENGTEKYLGEFEHPTAVTLQNPFTIDLSNNHDLLKAIRFDVVNSLTNPTATGMNINEIHLTGYLYE